MGKEVTHITKLFRKQNLEGAFKTKNSICNVLNMNKVALQRTKYEISGVYQLRCPDCNLVYTGQTGRQFRIRYHEQLLDFNNNNNNNNYYYYYYNYYYYYYYYYYCCCSALAQYVIKNGRAMGNIDDITRKGKYYGEVHHLETNRVTQIKDKNTVLRNRIFDILMHYESGRWLKRF